LFKNRKLLVGLVFLILFYCSFPFTKTQAAVNVGIVHSIESVKPIIDGVIDPVEWQNAIPIDVTLYYWSDQSIQRDVTLLSMFDDNSTLYLGAIIPELGQIVQAFYIIFKINVSEPLIYYKDFGAYTSSDFDTKAFETSSFKTSDFTTDDSFQINDVPSEQYYVGSGHDVKSFDIIFNTTSDQYTIADVPNVIEDTDVGGSNDGICKCTSNSTHTVIEIAMPFDSGDRIGYDLELDYGESIEFALILYDGDSYSQGRSTDKDYDYCVLKIEKLLAPALEEISPLINNDGSITINWNDVLEATSYNVYRDTSAFSDISGLVPIATPIDSLYYDNGLSNGLTYYYAITAENTYGVSELSNVEQVMIHITTTSETSVSIIIILINLFGVCLGVFLIKSRKTKLK